jgi:hypothetical protein
VDYVKNKKRELHQIAETLTYFKAVGGTPQLHNLFKIFPCKFLAKSEPKSIMCLQKFCIQFPQLYIFACVSEHTIFCSDVVERSIHANSSIDTTKELPFQLSTAPTEFSNSLVDKNNYQSSLPIPCIICVLLGSSNRHSLVFAKHYFL